MQVDQRIKWVRRTITPRNIMVNIPLRRDAKINHRGKLDGWAETIKFVSGSKRRRAWSRSVLAGGCLGKMVWRD